MHLATSILFFFQFLRFFRPIMLIMPFFSIVYFFARFFDYFLQLILFLLRPHLYHVFSYQVVFFFLNGKLAQFCHLLLPFFLNKLFFVLQFLLFFFFSLYAQPWQLYFAYLCFSHHI